MTTKLITIEMFNELVARVEALEQASKKPDVKEMTKEDALRILSGDMKDLKHKECAEKLGLTYGQVYSCRLEFTFKDVHKTLKNEGYKNPWVK
jgi:hypothetical protein